MLEDIKNKIKSFMSKPNEESYDMEKDVELIVASQSNKTIFGEKSDTRETYIQNDFR